MSQPASTCSSLTIETLEQDVKYGVVVLALRYWRRSDVFIVNF